MSRSSAAARAILSAAVFVATAFVVSSAHWTAAHSATTPAPVLSAHVHRACAEPARAEVATCFALIRDDGSSQVRDGAPAGYGPADLRSAYGLTSSTAAPGTTVAIVDAFDDPAAESDLAAYRARFGLPPCGSADGCFQKIDQTGGTSYPAADPGWAGETALDLDMVSAVCPQCHILLVEAVGALFPDLGTAVDTAVARGAVAVSNSYGSVEGPWAPLVDHHYDHAGVAITVSAGDGGYGVEYPASSQHVTAVGGTSLRPAATARGWSESAWSGTASGCSVVLGKVWWQKDAGCAGRTVSDVSAVADPFTGVAVYDTFQSTGWQVMGGTSVAAPIIAAVYALAGRPAPDTYPALYPYSHAARLNDVTEGATGTCAARYLCTAGVGYDGPTGMGTPDGAAAFSANG